MDEWHIPNVRHNLTSAESLSEQEDAKESEPRGGLAVCGWLPLLGGGMERTQVEFH